MAISSYNEPFTENNSTTNNLLPLAEQRNSPRPEVRARRRQRSMLVLYLLTTDAIALFSTFAVVYFLRFKLFHFFYVPEGSPMEFYSQLVFLMTPPWLLVFASYRLYDVRVLHGGTAEYRRISSACTLSIIVMLALSFFLDDRLTVSRAWLLMVWVMSILLIVSSRFLTRRMLYHLRRQGMAMTRVLMIGANNEARQVALHLSQGRNLPGMEVVGFVGERRTRARVSMPYNKEDLDSQRNRNENNKFPARWLGDLEDVRRIVEEHHIDEVIISSTALSGEQLFEVVRVLTTSNVEIRLSPSLYEILTTGMAIQEINGLPLVTVNKVRITGLNAILKRSLDILVSAGVLLLASPFLIAALIMVRMDSPGPAIHRRRVVGQGGKVFDAYKLRTMRTDGDKILAANPELLEELRLTGKLKNDPRVTRLGGFLRKTSLDELPQLFNVLRGQMSLVGPRMLTYHEMIKFGRWQSNLMTVKPGLTGLWQVSGRSNLTYEDRVRLDMHYIRNYSLWIDLRILFQTIPAVLMSRGAY